MIAAPEPKRRCDSPQKACKNNRLRGARLSSIVRGWVSCACCLCAWVCFGSAVGRLGRRLRRSVVQTALSGRTRTPVRMRPAPPRRAARCPRRVVPRAGSEWAVGCTAARPHGTAMNRPVFASSAPATSGAAASMATNAICLATSASDAPFLVLLVLLAPGGLMGRYGNTFGWQLLRMGKARV